jgi:hypothetical protein
MYAKFQNAYSMVCSKIKDKDVQEAFRAVLTACDELQREVESLKTEINRLKNK